MKGKYSAKTAHTVIPSGDKVSDFRNAIVNDDVKLALTLLTKDSSLARLSYGRFPVLSLLYLYNSRKILKKAGVRFTMTEYIPVDENPADYVRFRELTGRSLRLFGEGYVTPEEMLAVIGDAPTLRSALKKNPSPEKSERIAKIYTLSGKGKVKIEGNQTKIPHSKHMNLTQILAVILVVIFALAVSAGAMGAYYSIPSLFGGDGSEGAPIFISNEEQFLHSAGDENDRFFLLKENLTLSPATLTDTALSANISGENHTIKVDGDLRTPLFSEINGSIKNVTFDFGEIDIVFNSDTALLARSVSGSVSNVKIIARGKITDTSGNETVKFGCLTVNNSGTISNVELDINLEVTGASSGGVTSEDVFFAGIAAVNSGTISYCSTSAISKIKLDTVDGAAIVAENAGGGRVLDSVNNASVVQTTSYYHWSPNTAGIVLNNNGTINNCINNGAITSSSRVTKEQYEENSTEDNKNSHTIVYAGGIVCNNYGDINHCKNTGDITASSAYSHIYVGGITATISSENTTATIANSISSGVLTAASEAEKDENPSVELFVGGIVGSIDYVNFSFSSFNTSIISNCISLMSYAHSGYQFSFFGAISGIHGIYSIYGIMNYSFPNYINNTYASGKGFIGGIGCIFNVANSLFDVSKYIANSDILGGGTTAKSEDDIKAQENYW